MLWDRFYGDMNHAGAYKDEFLTRLETLGIIDPVGDKKVDSGKRTTTAALQGLFLFNEGDMRGAIDNAPQLIAARTIQEQPNGGQQLAVNSSG